MSEATTTSSDVRQSAVGETLPSDGFEEAFRRDYPLVWFGTLVGPFVLTGVLLLCLWAWLGGEYVAWLLGTAAATFFLLGKFVILGGGEGVANGAFHTSEELALLVFYLDMMTATLLVFHVDFLFRLPWVGGKLRALMEDGRFILETNPWMRRVTFVGLIAFVTFPLAATGSVGGSIFGRLLGLSRLMTLAGIALGSVAGCALMYFGSEVIKRYLDRDNPFLVVGGIAFLAVILLVLNLRYRQLKNRYLNRTSA